MRERDAGNGKTLSSLRCRNDKNINSLVASCQYGHFITRRVEPFCFSASPPCGMRSLFLRGQRKAKKPKALRPLCLCGESIFIKTHLGLKSCHPFKGLLLTNVYVYTDFNKNKAIFPPLTIFCLETLRFFMNIRSFKQFLDKKSR